MLAFLIANMIYMDGLVSLFAFGGIYAAGTFGWNTIQIGTFGILLAISGTIGAWLGVDGSMMGARAESSGCGLDLLGAISFDPAHQPRYDLLYSGDAARSGWRPVRGAR
jgi:UMF1 family MFS transporter